MHFSTLSSIALFSATLVSALPTALTEFYLVTSVQSNSSTNSSQLQGVSATTPYDEFPAAHTNLILRLLEPGYNTLPSFKLSPSTGVLSTMISSHGFSQQWNSTTVKENTELQFVASKQTANLGLGGSGDYLLSVDGQTDGWMICKSETGQSVLWWKATGEGCTKTYLHAVNNKPYRRV